MSVATTTYAQPVQVNGFTCKNCTEVDYAMKHIDPAHPKSGPYGVDAASDPSAKPVPVKPAAAAGTGKLIDISA